MGVKVTSVNFKFIQVHLIRFSKKWSMGPFLSTIPVTDFTFDVSFCFFLF